MIGRLHPQSHAQREQGRAHRRGCGALPSSPAPAPPWRDRELELLARRWGEHRIPLELLIIVVFFFSRTENELAHFSFFSGKKENTQTHTPRLSKCDRDRDFAENFPCLLNQHRGMGWVGGWVGVKE